MIQYSDLFILQTTSGNLFFTNLILEKMNSTDVDSFENSNPLLLAFYSSFFTWGGTALGAAMVFILPATTRKFLGTVDSR